MPESLPTAMWISQIFLCTKHVKQKHKQKQSMLRNVPTPTHALLYEHVRVSRKMLSVQTMLVLSLLKHKPLLWVCYTGLCTHQDANPFYPVTEGAEINLWSTSPILSTHPLRVPPVCWLHQRSKSKQVSVMEFALQGMEEWVWGVHQHRHKRQHHLIFFKAVLSKWEMGAGEMAQWSEGSVVRWELSG